MNFLRHSLLILAVLFTATVLANDCLPKSQNRLVNDYAGVLPKDRAAALEQQLVTFSRETSNQMVVVLTNDLCGLEPMEYATVIGHSWGVGLKEFDNGVVVLVSPKLRKTFIAVGYGLEGAIPDAIARRIVDQEMLPHFRNDDYAGGVEAATNVLMKLAKGEINAEDYRQAKGDDPLVVGLIFAFLLILFFMVGPVSSAWKYSMVNDVAFWTAMMLILNSRTTHGGAFGNFSSGRGHFGGGFGGGGGGGFGGFGGGGFGGGGAGGSW